MTFSAIVQKYSSDYSIVICNIGLVLFIVFDRFGRVDKTLVSCAYRSFIQLLYQEHQWLYSVFPGKFRKGVFFKKQATIVLSLVHLDLPFTTYLPFNSFNLNWKAPLGELQIICW